MKHEEIKSLSLAAHPSGIRRFRINKWHLATLALVLIVIIQFFLYLDLHSYYISQRSELQSEYNSLRDSYAVLNASYDAIQSQYYSFLSGYNVIRKQINMRTQEFSVEDFITPKEAAVENTVLQITGGRNTTSDWGKFLADVKKMYDWVVSNIKYRSDGLFPILPSSPSGNIEYTQYMWQFSNETLSLKEGDCKDMAILLTSMILSSGGEKAECIKITGSLRAHMGVQMLAAGGLTILDPAGDYYTRTLDGNIDSKDISTEISNWLEYWKPVLGSDVRVERVFSNSIDKEFSSTSEYIKWMYSR